MSRIVVLIVLCMVLTPVFGQSEAQQIFSVWHHRNGVDEQSAAYPESLKPGPDIMVQHITFEVDAMNKIHRAPLLPHDSMKPLALGQQHLTQAVQVESLTLRHEIQKGQLITSLQQVSATGSDVKIQGVIEVFYHIHEAANCPVTRGNCFKCGGRGKVGSWCTFCHNFVSWCIHGGGWRTCSACNGVGWIETYYQRCPRCSGRGYVGVWCTFCHAHVIWCIHGRRWANCGTCGGKGAIGQEYSTCSTCRGRGYVGTHCPFCHATVIWCIHGRSPRTCGTCGGKGCVK